MDSNTAIESVHINRLSVLSRLNLEKYRGSLSLGTKETVRNNKLSELSRHLYSKFEFNGNWSVLKITDELH